MPRPEPLPVKCTRCERLVPPGTLITPCCGVWLWTNGPADPGMTLYDSKVVDLDLAKIEREHSAAIQQVSDVVTANANAQGALTTTVGALQAAHNSVTTWTASRVKSLRNRIYALAVLNLTTLTLLLLHVR